MTDAQILEAVGLPAAVEGLAEESSEVTQAALKYGRALRQENPTPITAEAAREELRKELGDLLVYCQVLGIYPDVHYMEDKNGRWKDRVEEARRGDDGAGAEPGGEGMVTEI